MPAVKKRNIKLTVEYDGTDYAGWQVQPNERTIQEELEKAIGKATGAETRVTGSGRTDAGVHAEGQVANFFTGSALPPERMMHALNYYLPFDIAVIAASEVPLSFHARKDAVSKLYRYRILPCEVRRPLRSRYALLVRDKLDAEAMRRCADRVLGAHDFAAFASESFRYKSTVREVFRSELIRIGDELQFMIAADGFLYNMVRAIVGTLLDAGRGKLGPEQFQHLLVERDRSRAGATAPAHGLCIVSVDYGRKNM